MRALIVAMILLGPIVPAQSEIGPVTCEQIRTAVWYYGPARTLAWAKSNGMSDQRIARLKLVCKIPSTF